MNKFHVTWQPMEFGILSAFQVTNLFLFSFYAYFNVQGNVATNY